MYQKWIQKHTKIFWRGSAILAVALLFVLLFYHTARADTVNKSFTGITSAYLNSNLIAYWPFDGKYISWSSATVGTTTDVSGNGHSSPLTNMNRAIAPILGKMGQALKFNGTNSVIKIGNSNTYYTSTQTQFTITTWFKTSTAANGIRIITFPRATGSTGISLGTDSSGNNITFNYRDSSNAIASIVTGSTVGPVANGKWHFLAMVISGVNASLYLDNVLKASSTNVGDANTFTSGAFASCIGAGADCASTFWNGAIDDLRLYNTALSASELSELYMLSATVNKSNTGITNNDLSSGLVGYYPFDGKYMTWKSNTVGTSSDASGNGNNGTLANMTRAQSVVLGKAGQALAFDGSSAYVQTPTTLVGAGEVSVCAWIKQATFVGATNVILANTKFFFYTSSTNNTLSLSSDGTLHADSATNAIVNGTWQYVCGTRDSGGIANIYVNGALSSTSNQTSGTPAVSTFNTDIGARGTGLQYFFNGLIDDVRVYSRVLSATEISQLYYQDLGIVNKTPIGLTNTDLTTGLVGYWPFDGKYMTWSSATVGTSSDASGNGNNGRLVSMNQSTSTVPGKMGQALSFNGINSSIDIPSVSNPSSAFTFSMWVKWTTYVSNVGLGGKTNGSSQGFFMYANGSTQPACYVNTTNTSMTSSTVKAGVWYFLTCTWNGSTLQGYLNGVAGTPVSAPVLTGSSQDFSIGTVVTTGYLKGSIDDVRLYSRALSQTEITQLYDLGK